MDTSDSENFESADEDIPGSDSNDESSVKHLKKSNKIKDVMISTNDKTNAENILKLSQESLTGYEKELENKPTTIGYNYNEEKLEIIAGTVNASTKITSYENLTKIKDEDDIKYKEDYHFSQERIDETDNLVKEQKEELNKLSKELDGWDSWSDDDDDTTVEEKLQVKEQEHKDTRKKQNIEKLKGTNKSSDNTGTKIQQQEKQLKEDNVNKEFEGWDNWDDVLEQHFEIKPGNKSKMTQNFSKDEPNDGWKDFNKHKNENSPKEEQKNVVNVIEKLSLNEDSKTWGAWGNWGVSSLISTATDSVQTFTTQVSQGLNTVIENSLGVPSPEELAKFKNENKSVDNSNSKNELSNVDNSFGGFTSLMSTIGVNQLTKLVETTGSKVVNTGLDTLEVIGKKTMEVLQEGDPGLAKKRALLVGFVNDKPVLSQILREAKEKAEIEDKELEKCHTIKRVHFETLFDDNQGLVHLEALEMLSKQCDIKLETILEDVTDESTLNDLKETILQVKELCELPDEEDEEHDDLEFDIIKQKIEKAVEELKINIKYDKLIEMWKQIENELKLNENMEATNLHEKAIETLAKLTACVVEQFHKTAEMLLIKERRSTADEADSLVQLTSVLISLVDLVAAKYSEKLNNQAHKTSEKDTELNSLITNVFFEATNSSSYIQDAFQLLIPILQVGAV